MQPLWFSALQVAEAPSDEKTEENTENTEQTGETTEGTDGIIKMGVSADFPPFESYADDAVTFVGFDIDLMQEICNRLGMELQIQDMNFDAIVAAVQTGKLDVGVSGITITDERKESVAFSDPYFVASQSILVQKDSPITSYEDLGKRRLYSRCSAWNNRRHYGFREDKRKSKPV